MLYPVQTKPQPAGLKGHIELDPATCILCGMCDRSCATNCITVSKADRYWEIDRFQCVQCGYCITVCPKKCLSMNPNYAPASTERKPDRIEVPEQADVAQKPQAAKRETPEAAPKDQAQASGSPVDAVLEGKLALMDADKAERVRAALQARAS